MKRTFTVVIFTENKIGLLNRVTTIFIQRHINIESMTTSESEYPGIHRFTVVVEETDEKIRKVVKQIEKQVEVLKALCFTNEETVYSEIALYKIKMSPKVDREALLQLLDKHQAHTKQEVNGFLIIEKTGLKEETHELFEALQFYGIEGFVRSGRVSLSNNRGTFARYLKEMESHSKEVITIN